MKITSKYILLFAGMLSTFIILSACTSSADSGTTAATATPSPWVGSTWQLADMNRSEPIAGTEPVMVVASETYLAGYTGCNLFNSSYILQGDQISLSVFQSSTITCDDPLKVQEDALLLILDSASNFKVEGDTLFLTNPDGERTATYERISPFPVTGTSWTLNSYNDGAGALVPALADSNITLQLEEGGQLSGFAGCNEYNAAYEFDARTISIGPIASTMMACNEPAGVMEQEAAYLQALENSQLYTNLGIALGFQTDNNTPTANYFRADE